VLTTLPLRGRIRVTIAILLALCLLRSAPRKEVWFMSKIRLTLACDTYDRTDALADGTVEPEGIDLNYIHLPVEETFWRMCQYHEFDISEMSLSSYMINLSRNDDFRAIPVFPSRAFRHDCIFINADSGIKEPQDLVGKRVGLPEYQITAAIFQRGLLQHEYEVQPTSIKWFQGGLLKPGREERTEIAYPKGISVQKLGPDQTLTRMLEDGEIDALLTARTPPNFSPDGNGPIRRLFPDFKKVEHDYYRKTAIFPIMHTVVLRKDVLDNYPWAAESVFKAFASRKIFSISASMMPPLYARCCPGCLLKWKKPAR
jgi:4,5-dihydroxyphthalate decarboxylase